MNKLKDKVEPPQLIQFIPLWLSIVTHGLSLGLILFFLDPPLSSKKILPFFPVKIVLNHQKVNPPFIQTKQERFKSKNKKSSIPRKVSIKDLGVQLYNLEKTEEVKSKKRPQGGVGSNDGNFLTGSDVTPMNSYKFESDKDFPLYQYLYQIIENNLTYPSELVEISSQGTVIAKLYFDQSGQYLRSSSEFQSSDSYLKIHVIRTLRKILATPLPEPFNKIERSFLLNGSFRFAITQNGDTSLIKAQKWIVGNHLFFYRSFYKSILEWKVGPVQGLGPASLGFNPMWFYEKAKELTTKKAKIDPLEKYRNDPEW